MNVPVVKNPLSMLAVFAALVEVICGIIAPFSNDETQLILIIFIVSFPVLLLGAFISILFLKPQFFYSPNEYHGLSDKVLEIFSNNPLKAKVEVSKRVKAGKSLNATNFQKITQKVNSKHSISFNSNDKLIDNATGFTIHTNFIEYSEKRELDYDQSLFISFILDTLTFLLNEIQRPKIEDLWVDVINYNYFFISVKIFKGETKAGSKSRLMYVVQLFKNDIDINFPQGEIIGVIAGSGGVRGLPQAIGQEVIKDIEENTRREKVISK